MWILWERLDNPLERAGPLAHRVELCRGRADDGEGDEDEYGDDAVEAEADERLCWCEALCCRVWRKTTHLERS